MSKVVDIIDDLKNIDGLTSPAQEELVSGTNIKTVGGQSLLGSGDIPTGTASGFTLLNTIQIAANTSVIYITLDNTYDSIKILMQGVSISATLNAGQINLLYSLNGTTYENSSTSYFYTSTSRTNLVDYSIPIVPINAYGGSGICMDINVHKQGMLQSFVSNPNMGNDIVVGTYNGSVGTGVKKVRISPSAGVFNAGEIKVIGVKYV